MSTHPHRCFQRSVLAVLFLAWGVAAHASRMHMPMGHYIRQADLIAIADTQRGGAPAYETVVSIREVLKGDAKLAGQTIVLTMGPRSTADAFVPAESKGIALLLKPGWPEAKEWPVLEAYQKPQEIQALRALVKICTMANERERLLALRATLAEANPVCQEELFAQLRDMRDPANFDLITGLYPSLDPANQDKLVTLIGEIGDLRGVPTLIQAVASPDPKVSAAAVGKLRWNFPGAPGVAEAFEKALGREHLTRTVAQYLARRNPDPKLKTLAAGTGTRWGQARRLLDSGDKAGARANYLELLKDGNEKYRMRLYAASLLIGEASDGQKEQIRKALLPLLAREKETDDYLLALQVAEVLRALRHPDCLDALIPILRWTPFYYGKAAYTATMAIRELGQEARQKATAQIIEWLKAPPPRTLIGENPLRYLLQLVWLGSPRSFEEAEPVMHAQYAAPWKALRPLVPVGQQEDEGAFLTQRLLDPHPFPREAREWVLFRLGDLKDTRAVRELARFLVGEQDWGLSRAAAEALIQIGGPLVEEEMTRLLTHEDLNRVRRHAIEVLFRLQGERSLALSHRMLAEKDFGLKGMAISSLGGIGTPDDLKLLLPLCDYWTADRSTHYWAMSAVAAIRDRYSYDINGPIKTAP